MQCSDLNEKVFHSLRPLNSWYLTGGAVWVGLGVMEKALSDWFNKKLNGQELGKILGAERMLGRKVEMQRVP